MCARAIALARVSRRRIIAQNGIQPACRERRNCTHTRTSSREVHASTSTTFRCQPVLIFSIAGCARLAGCTALRRAFLQADGDGRDDDAGSRRGGGVGRVAEPHGGAGRCCRAVRRAGLRQGALRAIVRRPCPSPPAVAVAIAACRPAARRPAAAAVLRGAVLRLLSPLCVRALPRRRVFCRCGSLNLCVGVTQVASWAPSLHRRFSWTMSHACARRRTSSCRVSARRGCSSTSTTSTWC